MGAAMFARCLLLISALGIASAPSIEAGDAVFVRGDFNGDGGIDLSDPVAVLSHLFLDSSGAGCPDAGDSNDDGELDLSDALHMLFYLFLDGRAPPPPFPGCNGDTTQDGLDCPGYPRCPPESELNEVVSIRKVDAGVEIEVHSSKEFPVRALYPILCIAARGFERSRGPGDGSLNTLIFTLTQEEFGETRSGDPLSVQYGYCDLAYEERTLYWDLWVFGVLDKGLLR